jgi:hypothetical protein
MVLLNLPSAVRRAALARTPVAASTVGFRCVTPDVVFIAAARRLFRGLAFVAFFLLFFIGVPSFGTPLTIRVSREKASANLVGTSVLVTERERPKADKAYGTAKAKGSC